ncbi:hypothetical protein MTO96_004390 [Rhipicephalus appendiculatus]
MPPRHRRNECIGATPPLGHSTTLPPLHHAPLRVRQPARCENTAARETRETLRGLLPPSSNGASPAVRAPASAGEARSRRTV